MIQESNDNVLNDFLIWIINVLLLRLRWQTASVAPWVTYGMVWHISDEILLPARFFFFLVLPQFIVCRYILLIIFSCCSHTHLLGTYSAYGMVWIENFPKHQNDNAYFDFVIFCLVYNMQIIRELVCAREFFDGSVVRVKKSTYELYI